MIQLTTEAIQIEPIEASVRTASCGASLVFVGRVRGEYHGQSVLRLEYEAYEEMALSSMREIAQEAKTQWGAEVAIVHRIGVVLPEAVSVVIAVATPHRAAAYEANRFVLEALKQRVPIWKKEVTPNGASWKENQSPKAANQQ